MRGPLNYSLTFYVYSYRLYYTWPRSYSPLFTACSVDYDVNTVRGGYNVSEYYQDRGTPLSIEKDSQINVVVNRPDGDEGGIDLLRVFHVMKRKRRVYAWVLILCVVLGLCALPR